MGQEMKIVVDFAIPALTSPTPRYKKCHPPSLSSCMTQSEKEMKPQCLCGSQATFISFVVSNGRGKAKLRQGKAFMLCAEPTGSNRSVKFKTLYRNLLLTKTSMCYTCRSASMNSSV